MLLVGIERRAHAETSLNAIKMNMNDTLKGKMKTFYLLTYQYIDRPSIFVLLNTPQKTAQENKSNFCVFSEENNVLFSVERVRLAPCPFCMLCEYKFFWSLCYNHHCLMFILHMFRRHFDRATRATNNNNCIASLVLCVTNWRIFNDAFT